MTTLREKIVDAILDSIEEATLGHTESAADVILSLPELKEALNHYAACQEALANFGEFTVKRGGEIVTP